MENETCKGMVVEIVPANAFLLQAKSRIKNDFCLRNAFWPLCEVHSSQFLLEQQTRIDTPLPVILSRGTSVSRRSPLLAHTTITPYYGDSFNMSLVLCCIVALRPAEMSIVAVQRRFAQITVAQGPRLGRGSDGLRRCIISRKEPLASKGLSTRGRRGLDPGSALRFNRPIMQSLFLEPVYQPKS